MISGSDEPIQAYVFLSYASADRELAAATASVLEGAGIRVWMDRTGIAAGTAWAEEIVTAIQGCRGVLLLCSAASLASRNVRQEVQLACDHGRPVVPVLIENIELEGSLAYLLQGSSRIDATVAFANKWQEELIAAASILAYQTPVAAESITAAVEANRPAPLFGRESEVEHVVALLTGRSRLVTLTGPGGVGKTRLAREAAARLETSFPDGIIFVDLSQVESADGVLPAIGRRLSVRDSDERALRESLSLALRQRRLLLILDNFEQVIDAAPEVSALLAFGPDLKILVTSREALRIRGEDDVAVEPLAVPDDAGQEERGELAESAAVRLFVASAATAKPGFALTAETLSAIAGICRQVDGLPLAIELAASHIGQFSPEQMFEHLERRLPLLSGGSPGLPVRQQTMSRAIAWSYDLLSPDEQAMLRRLSVLSGGATLESAEAVVCAAGALWLDVVSGLTSLTEKNLMRLHSVEAGEPRFSMLMTVREFAGSMLEQESELDATERAAAAWARDYLEELYANERSMSIDVRRYKAIDHELENIRDAISCFDEQRDAESLARIFVRFFIYCYGSGKVREGRALGERALELARDNPLPALLHGGVQFGLALMWLLSGDPKHGESLARSGLALISSADPQAPLIAEGKLTLAVTLREQGRYEEALGFAEEVHRAAVEAHDLRLAAYALANVGRLAFLKGDDTLAETSLTEVLRVSVGAEPNEAIFFTYQYFVSLLIRKGELEQAAGRLREVMAIARDVASELYGLLLDVGGALAAATGRGQDAVRIFEAAEVHRESSGISRSAEPWIAEIRTDLAEQLGSAEFEAATQEGRSWRLDQAIALINDVIESVGQAKRTG